VRLITRRNSFASSPLPVQVTKGIPNEHDKAQRAGACPSRQLSVPGPPSFAIEPDVDSPAGPELPAPRYDRPDFQFDDQAGAAPERDIEGIERLGAAPEIVIPDDDIVEPVPPPAVPEPKTSPD